MSIFRDNHVNCWMTVWTLVIAASRPAWLGVLPCSGSAFASWREPGGGSSGLVVAVRPAGSLLAWQLRLAGAEDLLQSCDCQVLAVSGGTSCNVASSSPDVHFMEVYSWIPASVLVACIFILWPLEGGLTSEHWSFSYERCLGSACVGAQAARLQGMV
jgi:hypothetical protein